MRTEATLAEKQLWQRLKNKQLLGFKFRRQQVIDRFIVDFYCHEVKLVIEVDGEIHNYTQVEDAIREEFLESLGLRVVRFKNEDVLFRIEGVLEEIVQWLKPHPKPLPASEEGDKKETDLCLDIFDFIQMLAHQSIQNQPTLLTSSPLTPPRKRGGGQERN
ncbi:MAG: endonuclease domain-containing protein [Dolichospermum sp.]